MVTGMDLKGIMLPEVSLKKDKYYIISLVCGIQKTKQKQTHEIRRLIAAAGKGWGRGREREGMRRQERPVTE